MANTLPLQALIFDVDGTLADTERDGHRVAFNHAFEEAGLAWDWSVELYGELLRVTGGKERINHYLDTYLPHFTPKAPRDAFVKGLHEAKTRHYTELLGKGEIPLRPGVARLIQEAREAGLKIAIATTTTPANVEALIVNTLGADAMQWFAVIGAGDIVPAKKPAADIYDYVLQQLGLDASHCIAFEDSYNGIRSSRGAQLTTLVATNDYTLQDDFSGAALVVNHWGEPDLPFTVAAGDAHGACCVTLELLQQLRN
ncbi:MAG: HAD family hydrolase [Gammaproteobacteria bacterium]|nr:HAD family hydrolase [Gammaproteobacteria bacterium]